MQYDASELQNMATPSLSVRVVCTIPAATPARRRLTDWSQLSVTTIILLLQCIHRVQHVVRDAALHDVLPSAAHVVRDAALICCQVLRMYRAAHYHSSTVQYCVPFAILRKTPHGDGRRGDNTSTVP